MLSLLKELLIFIRYPYTLDYNWLRENNLWLISPNRLIIWLDNNIGNSNYAVDDNEFPYYIRFKHKEDVVAFKLYWL